MPLKRNTARELPVILIDDSDFKTGKTGVAFGDVTCKIRKDGASAWTSKTIDTNNWNEIGDGHYTIDFTAGNLDTNGLFEYIVQVTDALDFPGLFEIRDNTNDDLNTAIATRSTPAQITSAHAVTDGKLDNATYGLAALKTLLDAIDTSAESAARFTEIKGAGWTTETLKAIWTLVNAIRTENFTISPG
jgi:hypothetical protein